MAKQYLVRADLEFGFQAGVPTSTDLPVNLGPFQLDRSPNAELYLACRDLFESDWPAPGDHDPQFPMSLLYLELRYTCDDDDNPTKHADDALDRLEPLLRLFQPGEVSVLRHGVWRIDKSNRLTPAWSFSGYDFKPVKPPIEGLHEYGDYPLDDDALASLIEFIDRFWDALDNSPDNLSLAMGRFSSSYEKRDPADRLVDLVIALEALFGDRGDGNSVSYKIAMRGACWLHGTEGERRDAFGTIKKFYSDRSNVVHGNRRGSVTGRRVKELEGMIRSGLRKFLDWQVQQGKLPSGRDIDDLIMTKKI